MSDSMTQKMQEQDARIEQIGESGSYLTFFLMDEEYALEILKVQEIFGMLDVTPVPMTPPYMLGLINLRGRVIPIVDLRRKFDMGGYERNEQTCVIVCQVRGMSVGIVVDRVNEVAEIAEADIDETPSLGPGVRSDFLLGIGKSEVGVRLLLDIEKVLSTGDLEDMGAAAEGKEELLSN